MDHEDDPCCMPEIASMYEMIAAYAVSIIATGICWVIDCNSCDEMLNLLYGVPLGFLKKAFFTSLAASDMMETSVIRF